MPAAEGSSAAFTLPIIGFCAQFVHMQRAEGKKLFMFGFGMDKSARTCYNLFLSAGFFLLLAPGMRP
jgi:polysaccharide pyruvyl transferase WcaK-like protein